MKLTVAQAAVLPFQILEALNLPSGYERSFKFISENILANRYLLGINIVDTSPRDLFEICQRLQMPGELLEQFKAGLADANLVFLGFEAGANGGALFKIYLEYYERLQAELKSSRAAPTRHLLHKGFKWQYDLPDRNLVTEYHCLPDLSTAAICQRINSYYRGLPDSASLKAVMEIIHIAQARQPEQTFRYVDVSEAGNDRQSFDLNLYAAGLRINDVRGPIRDAAAGYNIDQAQLEQLLSITGDKLLGHVSAGFARNGKDYFTLYYES